MAGATQKHAMGDGEAWLDLPLAAWQETCATLHLWTQVIGKIRLALAPMTNHWWQVPLYVTARGLTTSPMPLGTRQLQIDFDFIDHRLLLATGEGATAELTLAPMSVADFYAETMRLLRSLGVELHIWTMPVELPDPIPFERDRTHRSYDRDWAQRHWRVLAQADRVLNAFRARFLGKASPVHFFWGSFDLAVTRFSGRPAPRHPGAPNIADRITREAYSHEVSSCGFWAGAGLGEPAFYAYAYPQPPGFAEAPVRPRAAHYNAAFGEFILPYAAIRRSAAPDDMLLDFLQSSYEAAADLAGWDRAALERPAAG
jgi:hypothetical protein